jgi:hypothetical protein
MGERMEAGIVLDALVAAMLRALGLSDHARPVSPHQVIVDEIIPAIVLLRNASEKRLRYEEMERLRRREVPHHRSGGGDRCGYCGSVEHTSTQHLWGSYGEPT